MVTLEQTQKLEAYLVRLQHQTTETICKEYKFEFPATFPKFFFMIIPFIFIFLNCLCMRLWYSNIAYFFFSNEEELNLEMALTTLSRAGVTLAVFSSHLAA